MIFGQEIKKYNRVSIPLNRFRIGLSGDGNCDSSQEYKEPSPYFSEIWLTIIKWLGIDITDSECSLCFVTFTYIKELPHSLGVQPALKMANIWGFRAFEVPGASKEQLCRKIFAWSSLLKSLSLTVP